MSTQSQHGVTVQQCPCGGQRTLFCVLGYFCCDQKKIIMMTTCREGMKHARFPDKSMWGKNQDIDSQLSSSCDKVLAT